MVRRTKKDRNGVSFRGFESFKRTGGGNFRDQGFRDRVLRF